MGIRTRVLVVTICCCFAAAAPATWAQGEDDQADKLAKLLHASMESAAELSVPLIVEVGKGSNWDEAH